MTQLAQQLIEKVAPFSQPVNAGSPAGDDLSYDPTFEQVKAEIEKLGSMAGEAPNWRLVIEHSEALLTSKTKDMRLLCWAAAARMQRDGLLGLAEGLAALHAVSGDHWDAMYPPIKRLKARGNLAGWLGDQVQGYLDAYTLRASDGAALHAVNFFHDELDGFLASKLEDAYSGMGALRRLLRDKIREIPAEPAPKPAAPAPAAPPAAAPSAAATPAATPAQPAAPAPAPASAPIAAAQIQRATNEEEVIQALRTIASAIQDCARVLRSADPAQAFAYRLQRTGAWLTVRQAPPSEQGKTRIPPPEPEELKKLQALQSGERWLELLLAAEDLTGQYLFWLDPHRLVVTAMDRLGATFLPAREAVVQGMRDLCQRQPQIPELSFADGTPFADAGTRSWLEELSAQAGAGGGGKSSKVSEEDEELAARLEEAKGLVTGGKVMDGLSLAAQLSVRFPDARARFRARLATAKMAAIGGQPAVARPLLEALLREAERHDLAHWEPLLCATLYSLWLEIVPASAPSPELKNGAPTRAEIFGKLCEIDPGNAVKFGGA